MKFKPFSRIFIPRLKFKTFSGNNEFRIWWIGLLHTSHVIALENSNTFDESVLNCTSSNLLHETIAPSKLQKLNYNKTKKELLQENKSNTTKK